MFTWQLNWWVMLKTFISTSILNGIVPLQKKWTSVINHFEPQSHKNFKKVKKKNSPANEKIKKKILVEFLIGKLVVREWNIVWTVYTARRRQGGQNGNSQRTISRGWEWNSASFPAEWLWPSYAIWVDSLASLTLSLSLLMRSESKLLLYIAWLIYTSGYGA